MIVAEEEKKKIIEEQHTEAIDILKNMYLLLYPVSKFLAARVQTFCRMWFIEIA